MTASDDALATVMRLGIAAEALAALAARLRADVEGIELDRDVCVALDDVVDRLGVDVGAMTAEERRRIAMSAQALLLQAADLLGDPGRPPGWAFEDPAVLLSTGWLSAGIAGDIAEIAPTLDGLQDALQRDGALFLGSAARASGCAHAPASRTQAGGLAVAGTLRRATRSARSRRHTTARPAFGRLGGRRRGARRAGA